MAAKKKAKKKPSKIKIRLRNRIYHLKSKNKKIIAEIEGYSKRKETTKIDFEGRKIMIKTYLNILKNKITKNNTAYSKVFKKLKEKYDYNPIGLNNKKSKAQRGEIRSPEYFAWETIDARQFISNISDGDNNLLNYFMEINLAGYKLESGQVFIMFYNRLKKSFRIEILNENS